LIVFAAIYLALLAVFAIWRASLLPLLQSFTVWARGYGILGYVAVAAATFFTAIPPVPGYGMIAILCGVIYGWMGVVPFYIGAILGATATFVVFRWLASGYARRLQQEHVRVAAVVRAVSRRGFKLLFFIRLAPYPFSLMNAILASSHEISFVAYFFATALTIPKLALNIALGAHLTDLADALIDHPTPERWLSLAGVVVMAVAVFVYVGWIALKEIRALEREGKVANQRRRKRVGPEKGEWV